MSDVDATLKRLRDSARWADIVDAAASANGADVAIKAAVRDSIGGRVFDPVTGGSHTAPEVLDFMFKVLVPLTTSGGEQWYDDGGGELYSPAQSPFVVFVRCVCSGGVCDRLARWCEDTPVNSDASTFMARELLLCGSLTLALLWGASVSSRVKNAYGATEFPGIAVNGMAAS